MRMNFSGRKNDAYTGKLLVANRNANLKTLADLKGKHLATQVGTSMYTGPLSSHHNDDSSMVRLRRHSTYLPTSSTEYFFKRGPTMAAALPEH